MVFLYPRRAPPRTVYEPCRFERSLPRYEDLPDGTVRCVRHFHCFHYMEEGRRSTCPYPARMCRPKLETEALP